MATVKNYYTNKITQPKNKLTTVNIFKTYDAKTEFYDKGTIKNNQTYTRNEIKKLLRDYITGNKKMFENCICQVAYISDLGIHYISEAVITGDKELSNVSINELMADPLSKYGYSGNNISIFEDTNKFYGIVLEILPIVPKKAVNKPKNKPAIKSKAPVLQFDETAEWQ